jgi:polyhydroxyalkanoate synthesis regulator phasin
MEELQSNENPLVRAFAVGIIDQLWMKGEIEADEGRVFVEPVLDDSDGRPRSRAQQLLDLWEHDERVDRKRSDSTAG